MSRSYRITIRKSKHERVRKKIKGTSDRPRLTVFRSLKYIYAQLIDDNIGKTIVSASSLKGFSGSKDSTETAKEVGKLIGKLAIEKNIQKVVFDRSGYLYHGRIKALAEGARESGLQF
ncbi:MAG: 50S ribosomal protein L18 [Nitrospirae bacterium]|nr:50S ribosomal protein L18 [Nitrospirota bacterium]MCL5259921.1 50S ribosomal protein L18 [Nitrospirota bacterium]